MDCSIEEELYTCLSY